MKSGNKYLLISLILLPILMTNILTILFLRSIEIKAKHIMERVYSLNVNNNIIHIPPEKSGYPKEISCFSSTIPMYKTLSRTTKKDANNIKIDKSYIVKIRNGGEYDIFKFDSSSLFSRFYESPEMSVSSDLEYRKFNIKDSQSSDSIVNTSIKITVGTSSYIIEKAEHQDTLVLHNGIKATITFKDNYDNLRLVMDHKLESQKILITKDTFCFFFNTDSLYKVNELKFVRNSQTTFKALLSFRRDKILAKDTIIIR